MDGAASNVALSTFGRKRKIGTQVKSIAKRTVPQLSILFLGIILKNIKKVSIFTLSIS